MSNSACVFGFGFWVGFFFFALTDCYFCSSSTVRCAVSSFCWCCCFFAVSFFVVVVVGFLFGFSFFFFLACEQKAAITRTNRSCWPFLSSGCKSLSDKAETRIFLSFAFFCLFDRPHHTNQPFLPSFLPSFHLTTLSKVCSPSSSSSLLSFRSYSLPRPCLIHTLHVDRSRETPIQTFPRKHTTSPFLLCFVLFCPPSSSFLLPPSFFFFSF